MAELVVVMLSAGVFCGASVVLLGWFVWTIASVIGDMADESYIRRMVLPRGRIERIPPRPHIDRDKRRPVRRHPSVCEHCGFSLPADADCCPACGKPRPTQTHAPESIAGLEAEQTGNAQPARQPISLAELIQFARRFIRTVAARYAELDELEATVAETVARADPGDVTAQTTASAARQRADESRHKLENAKAIVRDIAAGSPEILTHTYRRAAKAVHPDLADDEEDRARRHDYMARANQAHESGDVQSLWAIVCDWESMSDNIESEGIAAETLRMIWKPEQQLGPGDGEVREIDLFKLLMQAEETKARKRDLLAELSGRLQLRIAGVRCRLQALAREPADSGIASKNRTGTAANSIHPR